MGAVTLETWVPTTLVQAAKTHCSRASAESPAPLKTFGKRLVNPSIDLSASTLSMLYLGIVEGEIKVGAVVLGMALNTAYRNRHEAISFYGVLGMSAARSMARFALYIGELWSRIDGLEA